MNIIKAKDYAELSSIVADIIENQIKEKKDSFLGLATGSSPVGTYEMLRQRDIDFSKVEIYTHRRRANGSLSMARPCPSCMALIKDLGIKKIWYTTEDGYACEFVN